MLDLNFLFLVEKPFDIKMMFADQFNFRKSKSFPEITYQQ